jgi:MFS family permease
MPTPAAPRFPAPFRVIWVFYFLSFVASYALLPAMPLHLRGLGLGVKASGAFTAAFMLGSGLGALFTGPLGDRLGQREVLKWATLGAAACFAGYSLVSVFGAGAWPFFLAGAPHGVIWSGFRTATLAWVGGFLPEGRRADGLAIFGMAAPGGAALGPALGVWLMPRIGFPCMMLLLAALSASLFFVVGLLPKANAAGDLSLAPAPRYGRSLPKAGAAWHSADARPDAPDAPGRLDGSGGAGGSAPHPAHRGGPRIWPHRLGWLGQLGQLGRSGGLGNPGDPGNPNNPGDPGDPGGLGWMLAPAAVLACLALSYGAIPSYGTQEAADLGFRWPSALVACYGLGMVLFRLLMGWRGMGPNPLRLMPAMLAANTAAALGLALAPGGLLRHALFGTLYGASFGMAHTLVWTYTMTKVEAGRRGSATGALYFSYDLGIALGSFLMGFPMEHLGYRWGWAAAALPLCAAWPAGRRIAAIGRRA